MISKVICVASNVAFMAFLLGVSGSALGSYTVPVTPAAQTKYGPPYSAPTTNFYVPPSGSISGEISTLLSIYRSYYGAITGKCSYPITTYPEPQDGGAVARVDYTFPCSGWTIVYATVTPSIPAHCDDGFTKIADSGYPSGYACEIQKDKPKSDAGPSCDKSQDCGDPINSGNGNVYEEVTDYRGSGPFPLKLSRSYNSLYPSFFSRMGYHWHDNLEPDRIDPFCGGGYTYYVKGQKRFQCDYWEVLIERADGSQLPFFLPYSNYQSITSPELNSSAATLVSSSGAFTSKATSAAGPSVDASAGNSIELTSQGYVFHSSNGEIENFDLMGKLQFVTIPGGYSHFYHYDSSGNLVSVSDQLGHSIQIAYGTNGNLSTMTDPAGRVYRYSYDDYGNLTQVAYPDGTSVHYQYQDSAYPRALTGIVDQDGNQYATWKYDSDGRAIDNWLGNGANEVKIAYPEAYTAQISEADGTTRTLDFIRLLGQNKLIHALAPCAVCGDHTRDISYDSRGNIISRTDFDGNQTTYVRDSSGLELSRTEAAGTPQARTITTEWNLQFRKPALVKEPGKTTAYEYDAAGRLLSKTVTDTATGASRVTSYTYNSRGLLASVDGPRTDVSDVTELAYDSAGNVSSVTNALGQVTQITAYTADGWPLSIIDPNGVETDLTYDPRGRLLTRTVAGATTRFKYDAAGQLTKVTLSTGSYLKYAYDSAHRLTAIQDALGNKIAFTLDPLGNRVEEDDLDPNGLVKHSLKRVYDELNHLSQTVGGAGQTSNYSHDEVGNLTTVTDPLGKVSHQTFDALNRVVVMVNPENGETTFNRDPQDHVDDVTDPRGLDTHYDYDAFGDVVGRDSPDTGYTDYTYDSAGNRLTKTDARGVTATYSYDALNRLTTINYPDPTKDVTYTYDQGTYGIGHLTSMQDASGTTAYSYDARGNLVKKSTTVDGHTFSLSYAYDLADELTGITYPDGMQVQYSRDAAGRVMAVDVVRNGVTQTLVNNVTYEPFGPIKSMVYGNGSSESRTYDKSYRPTGISVPGVMEWDLASDADDNIVNIADSLNAANSQVFTYDTTNRLATADGSYGSQTYHYDLDGNRTSLSQDGVAQTYSYGSSSNRLLSAGTRTFQYDAAGNTVSDGTHTYTYDVTNRLTGYDDKPDVYLYNGLGQRVRKPIPVKPGDANGDGIIDQNDLHSLQSALKGATSQSAGMDCNQDGVIDNQDKSCIANQIGATKNHGQGKGVTTTTATASATPSGASVLYQYMVYDQAGHLLGEYDENGNLIQEHIWLGNRPTGVVTSDGVYYISTDQLGTPLIITDTNQRVVWRWGRDPFGNGTVNENPSGVGLFTYNLRFPGQHYDAETGRSYNYFRDYDSGIGRYVEGDPIGLLGGADIYTYAAGGPISNSDRYGLYPMTGMPMPGLPSSPSALDELVQSQRASQVEQRARILHVAHMPARAYATVNCNGQKFARYYRQYQTPLQKLIGPVEALSSTGNFFLTEVAGGSAMKAVTLNVKLVSSQAALVGDAPMEAKALAIGKNVGVTGDVISGLGVVGAGLDLGDALDAIYYTAMDSGDCGCGN